jgi:hypothetical protein
MTLTSTTEICEDCKHIEECERYPTAEDICDKYECISTEERRNKLYKELTIVRHELNQWKQKEQALLYQLAMLAGRKPVIELISTSCNHPVTKIRRAKTSNIPSIVDRLRENAKTQE